MIEVATVVVRALPSTFERCIRPDPTLPINMTMAHAQHNAYRAALAEASGVDVAVVPADDASPDCVFVEDTIVFLDTTHAVMTRPGAVARRGEVSGVARFIERMGVTLYHMSGDGATVDGGDVLRVSRNTIVVGLSTRSTELGVAQLRDFAAPFQISVVTVNVASGLHLKCACSLVDERTLVYDPTVGLDLAVFAAVGLRCVEAAEGLGANVIALGKGRVVMSAAAPITAQRLMEAVPGLVVITVEMSELHKADGSPTCPSVRIPAPGAWST